MKIFLACCTLALISTAYCQDSIIESYAVTVNTEIKPKKQRFFDHDYGPLSISTNLTALFSIYPYNRRWSIEPEYQFTDQFSLKVPLMIGFDKAHTIGAPEYYSTFYSPTYSGENFDINTIPEINVLPSKLNEIDVIFQTGISPKYYFNGKSKSYFSYYGSVALNVGIADQYSLYIYDRLDSTSYYDSWEQTEVEAWDYADRTEEYRSDEFVYFNHEVLVGMDYNFSRRITCTLEMGYSSKFFGRPQRQDHLYTAILDGAHELTHEGPFETYNRRDSNVRLRFLLTARF